MISSRREERGSNLQSIDQESIIGVKRPADSQLIAIDKRDKRNDMKPFDESSSIGAGKFVEAEIETEVDEHLPEQVEENETSSDESGDLEPSDIDYYINRTRKEIKHDNVVDQPSSVSSEKYLIWAYSHAFGDDNRESKHKEFLDKALGSSNASQSYRGSARVFSVDIFSVMLTKAEYEVLSGKEEIEEIIKPCGPGSNIMFLEDHCAVLKVKNLRQCLSSRILNFCISAVVSRIS